MDCQDCGGPGACEDCLCCSACKDHHCSLCNTEYPTRCHDCDRCEECDNVTICESCYRCGRCKGLVNQECEECAMDDDYSLGEEQKEQEEIHTITPPPLPRPNRKHYERTKFTRPPPPTPGGPALKRTHRMLFNHCERCTFCDQEDFIEVVECTDRPHLLCCGCKRCSTCEPLNVCRDCSVCSDCRFSGSVDMEMMCRVCSVALIRPSSAALIGC